jgi:hypothetical protein
MPCGANRSIAPTLLRNDAPAGNPLDQNAAEGSGSNSNRSAIGARVLVRYAGKVQAQWVTSQSSFLSANDPRLHFGQETAAKVSVEVHWPPAQSES